MALPTNFTNLEWNKYGALNISGGSKSTLDFVNLEWNRYGAISIAENLLSVAQLSVACGIYAAGQLSDSLLLNKNANTDVYGNASLASDSLLTLLGEVSVQGQPNVAMSTLLSRLSTIDIYSTSDIDAAAVVTLLVTAILSGSDIYGGSSVDVQAVDLRRAGAEIYSLTNLMGSFLRDLSAEPGITGAGSVESAANVLLRSQASLQTGAVLTIETSKTLFMLAGIPTGSDLSVGMHRDLFTLSDIDSFSRGDYAALELKLVEIGVYSQTITDILARIFGMAVGQFGNIVVHVLPNRMVLIELPLREESVMNVLRGGTVEGILSEEKVGLKLKEQLSQEGLH